MNKSSVLLLASAAMFCQATLTGCIDNDYDLSDLDKTVQLTVNDLTIPVNLDEIYLKNILKPDDDSSIKELDGEYAVVQNGTLTSDGITIARQHVAAPVINPSVEDIFEGTDIPDEIEIEPTEEVHSYSIVDINGDFTYDKNDIPDEILSIRRLSVDWTISIKVSVTDPDGAFRGLTFADVIISLPKGLTMVRDIDAQRYDAVTGDYNLGTVNVPNGQLEYTLSAPVKAVDFTGWSAENFSFTPGTGSDNGKLHISGNVGVKSGEAVVTILIGNNHPSTVSFCMQPSMTAIDVNTFSGRLQYSFSDFNIPSVRIDDLPDLLSDPSTNIVLDNPQLYVSVNNPIANYDLDIATGVTLTPVRSGIDGSPCSLDPGQQVTIGHDKGVAGPYTFCISPSTPDKYYQGWEGAEHVGCSDFANILSGEGIPTVIKVDCNGARVLPGEVDDFRLGVDIGKISGNYTVYCPLSLGVGSKVVYSDTIDGWNDDTVDRIVISSLDLSTDVTNNLPFDVVLSGYPLSLNDRGDAIQSVDPETGSPVTISEVTIPAGTTTAVTLHTTGTVVRLDGIHFVARAEVSQPDQVLSPDTAIRLANIKATVSGTYTDTL